MTDFISIALTGTVCGTLNQEWHKNGYFRCNCMIKAKQWYYTKAGNRKENHVLLRIYFIGRDAETFYQYVNKRDKIFVTGRLLQRRMPGFCCANAKEQWFTSLEVERWYFINQPTKEPETFENYTKTMPPVRELDLDEEKRRSLHREGDSNVGSREDRLPSSEADKGDGSPGEDNSSSGGSEEVGEVV